MTNRWPTARRVVGIFFPQREALKIDGHGYSPTILHRILHMVAVTSSYDIAATALDVVSELPICSRQINKLATAIGTEMASDRDARTRQYVEQPLPRQATEVDECANVKFVERIEFSRQKGDHLVYIRSDLIRPVVFPKDQNIPIFVIRNNLRILGISHNEYLNILKATRIGRSAPDELSNLAFFAMPRASVLECSASNERCDLSSACSDPSAPVRPYRQ